MKIFLTRCYAVMNKQNRITQPLHFFLKCVHEHQYTTNILQTIKYID